MPQVLRRLATSSLLARGAILATWLSLCSGLNAARIPAEPSPQAQDHRAAATPPEQPRAIEEELSAKSLPCAAARSRLPETFRLHETARFALLTDVSDSAAQQHAFWLERTYEEFTRFTQEMQLAPQPLDHKLVCVLFDHSEAYRDFARANDGVSDMTIGGYYSPRHDRVVFAIDRAPPTPPTFATSASGASAASPRSPEVASSGGSGVPAMGGASGLTTMGSAVSGATAGGVGAGGVGAAPVLPFESQQQADHVHDHACSSDSAAKCVHETIHQLMFHTRVMSPQVQYPLWVCEGLSTAFETDDPSLDFGPDVSFQPRQRGFERLLANDRLIPLRELVQIAQPPRDSAEFVRAAYNQSYALVRWLVRERPEEFRQYLDLMREQRGGRHSSSRHLGLFERAFGDVEAFEAEWLAHERESLELD